ncbi:hypothetical protein M2165_002918 [Variovorax sp. TBS-050B]|nr:hypothetical protein [Variovorax sp. TBS-050B]
MAIASSGKASSASLRRASSGAISSDVLGWFDSRRSAWVSLSRLKGSNAAPSGIGLGRELLGLGDRRHRGLDLGALLDHPAPQFFLFGIGAGAQAQRGHHEPQQIGGRPHFFAFGADARFWAARSSSSR